MRNWLAAGAIGVFMIGGAGAARAESDPVEMRHIGPVATAAAPDAETLPVPPLRPDSPARAPAARGGSPDGDRADDLRVLIARHAAEHGVPAALADAVARLESRYNPRAAHAGNYGLMQIRLQTARGEGYSGSAQGLLDADTNARFGVRYLARAWRLANGDVCGAIMRYQSGLRAIRMSGANRAYCGKVKALMAGA